MFQTKDIYGNGGNILCFYRTQVSSVSKTSKCLQEYVIKNENIRLEIFNVVFIKRFELIARSNR